MKQNIIIVLLSAICGILGYMAAKIQDRPDAVQVATLTTGSPGQANQAATSMAVRDGRADTGRPAETAPSKKSDRICNKIGLPNPPYPEEAKNSGISGSVTLEFEVSDDGRGQNAVIVKSSGNTILDNAALRAAKSGVYKKGNSECFKTTIEFFPY